MTPVIPEFVHEYQYNSKTGVKYTSIFQNKLPPHGLNIVLGDIEDEDLKLPSPRKELILGFYFMDKYCKH